MIGVKEVPVEELVSDTTYLFNLFWDFILPNQHPSSYPSQLNIPIPFHASKILNRHSIFGFPQYEPMKNHIDPFRIHFVPEIFQVLK